MSHRAPVEGTANVRQHYKDPDGRETVVHYPDLSAKHADEALGCLIRSRGQDLDSRDRDRLVAEATVLATLSLRDKLDELEATVRTVVVQAADTSAELSRTIKTATQAVVVELRKHQVKPVESDSNGAAA